MDNSSTHSSVSNPERSNPDDAEGSSPKNAEGSYPNDAEGSYPKNAEGSYPKSAEGSYPKSAEGSSPNDVESFSDNQLLRYSRQIMLPQWDMAGQLATQNSRVLVIGVGGLGSPASLYLAAAGIGHLVLVDDDRVELSNLQRQVAHTEAQLGVNKAVSGEQAALARNSDIRVTAIGQRLDEKQLQQEVQRADVVLDCSDNLSTRLAVNEVCAHLKTPLVSAAAIGFSGQLSVFNLQHSHSPCYRCLYDESLETSMNCSENGVFAPLVGVLGAAQAVEALKIISGVGSPIVGQLQLYDALGGEWRSLRVQPLASCPVCGDILRDE